MEHLLSRTAGGLIAEAAGTWRAGVAVAAGALLLVLRRSMPADPPASAGNSGVVPSAARTPNG